MEGYQIGFKELYDQLVQLNGKVDQGLSQHTVQITEVSGRVTALENAVAARWQTNLAIASSAVALVCAFVAPLMLR